MALTWNVSLDPSSPPTRVRPDLTAQEDRPACLRWLALRQLRQGPRRSRFLDRGAEDCQEGHEGGREEGEDGQAIDVFTFCQNAMHELGAKRMD